MYKRQAHGEAARRLEARLEDARAAAEATRAERDAARRDVDRLSGDLVVASKELASTRDVMDAAERDATALLRAERDAAAGLAADVKSLTDARDDLARRVETGARRARDLERRVDEGDAALSALRATHAAALTSLRDARENARRPLGPPTSPVTPRAGKG